MDGGDILPHRFYILNDAKFYAIYRRIQALVIHKCCSFATRKSSQQLAMSSPRHHSHRERTRGNEHNFL